MRQVMTAWRAFGVGRTFSYSDEGSGSSYLE
jgi:hypothetical protein